VPSTSVLAAVRCVVSRLNARAVHAPYKKLARILYSRVVKRKLGRYEDWIGVLLGITEPGAIVVDSTVLIYILEVLTKKKVVPSQVY
jgi:hypothetical protein